MTTLSRYLSHRVTLGALLVLSFFAFQANPILDAASVDSSVFAYVGGRILEGEVPYKDVFDHKGPLIYFINSLGFSFGWGLLGVWMVECLLFAGSMIYLYRTLLQLASAETVGLVMFPIGWGFLRFFSGGNMTESYAFYFIIFALCPFIVDIWAGRLRKRTCLIMGSMMGAVFMLRPNMVTLGLPFVIYLVHQSVVKYKWCGFVIFATYGLVGLFSIWIGPLIYFTIHSAIRDLWSCMIGFNIEYSKICNTEIDCNLFYALVMLVIGGGCTVWASEKWRRLLIYNQIYMVFALGVITLKLLYSHYYLPFVPACILPLLYVFIVMKQHRFTWVLVGVCLCCAGWGGGVNVLASNFSIRALSRRIMGCPLKDDKVRRDSFAVYEEYDKYMEKGGRMTVIGNDCYAYYRLGRTTSWRYPYQTVARFSSAIENEVISDLKSQSSDYLLVPRNCSVSEAIRQHIEAYYAKEYVGLRYALMKRK